MTKAIMCRDLRRNVFFHREMEKHQLRSESCVGTHLLIMFANMQRGWGQSVLSRELHTKKELRGCL